MTMTTVTTTAATATAASTYATVLLFPCRCGARATMLAPNVGAIGTGSNSGAGPVPLSTDIGDIGENRFDRFGDGSGGRFDGGSGGNCGTGAADAGNSPGSS